jgi:hypothetical protein
LQQHIGDLIDARQREADAAKAIDDQILGNRERAQEIILGLQRLGLDDAALMRSKEKEEAAALAAFKAELAKGEGADQERLNELASKAIGLIASNAKEKFNESKSDYERSKAIEKINQITASLNGTLGTSKEKHEDNKTAIENELSAAKNGAEGIKTAIGQIDEKLVDGKKLAVQVDQVSLAAAQKQIDELKKPETKVITVVTQNAGDAPAAQRPAVLPQEQTVFSDLPPLPLSTDLQPPAQQTVIPQLVDVNPIGSAPLEEITESKTETKTKRVWQRIGDSYSYEPYAQQTGGLAGLPTGEPWRFNVGGYAPLAGLLPGYGGGDTIKALLERGEFIVRKEAVKALGLPALQTINRGQLPVETPIRRAIGGLVSSGGADATGGQTDGASDDITKLMAELRALVARRSAFLDSLNRVRSMRPADMAKRNLTREKNLQDAQALIGRFKDLGYNLVISETAKRFGGTQALLNGQLLKFATGGLVPGIGNTDNVLSMLMPGEFVMKKSAVAQLGTEVLDALNRGVIPQKLQQASAAAQPSGGKTFTVRFELPDTKTVAGQFAEDDATRLIEMLRTAGLRTF